MFFSVIAAKRGRIKAESKTILTNNTQESMVAETKMHLICFICMEKYKKWHRGQEC